MLLHGWLCDSAKQAEQKVSVGGGNPSRGSDLRCTQILMGQLENKTFHQVFITHEGICLRNLIFRTILKQQGEKSHIQMSDSQKWGF